MTTAAFNGRGYQVTIDGLPYQIEAEGFDLLLFWRENGQLQSLAIIDGWSSISKAANDHANHHADDQDHEGVEDCYIDEEIRAFVREHFNSAQLCEE